SPVLPCYTPLFVVAVVRTEGRLKSELVIEANQLPAGLVVIAAIRRVGEESHDRMQADLCEEIGPLHRSQQLDLLGGGQVGKLVCAWGEFSRPGSKVSESFGVNRL